eukprot:1159557-Pelagomonas_calceolata.AAC.3
MPYQSNGAKLACTKLLLSVLSSPSRMFKPVLQENLGQQRNCARHASAAANISLCAYHTHLLLVEQQTDHDEAGIEAQALDSRAAADGLILKVLPQADCLHSGVILSPLDVDIYDLIHSSKEKEETWASLVPA